MVGGADFFSLFLSCCFKKEKLSGLANTRHLKPCGEHGRFVPQHFLISNMGAGVCACLSLVHSPRVSCSPRPCSFSPLGFDDPGEASEHLPLLTVTPALTGFRPQASGLRLQASACRTCWLLAGDAPQQHMAGAGVLSSWRPSASSSPSGHYGFPFNLHMTVISKVSSYYVSTM